jgi:hypothetical protein
MPKRLWSQEEDRVLEENYEFNPAIWELLPGRTRVAIVQRANKIHGLSRRCGDTKVNFRFFDAPWTKDSVKVLGFFISDGHLSDKWKYLSFSQAECAPLKRIMAVMQCEARIQEKKNRKEFAVYIYNGHIGDRLHELGFDSRKTFTARIPDEIPVEFYPRLLSGIHEADGSVGLEHDKNRPDRICGYVQFLGSRHLLRQTRSYLISRGFTKRVHVRRHGKTKTYALKYKDQQDVIGLIELLYPPNGLWFTRKRDEALAVLAQVEHYQATKPGRTAEHNRKIMMSNIASRGRVWPDLMSPDGVRVPVLSTGDVARQYGLSQIGVWSVLCGKQNQHQGWTRAA